jgi:type I restriction enzyme R subunit
MKNREVDMLIVVSMFLTGFDAKTLNTLWVDKNLRMHGLLQAYSRTNRILNSIKDCGNIVCFRNLEKETNDSLALFGDTGAKGIAIMRPFKDYYEGYVDDKGKKQMGYIEIVATLLAQFSLPLNPVNISIEEKKLFVKLFGAFLKMQNLLSVFDEFTEEKRGISEFDKQDYLSWYIDLRGELTNPGGGNGGPKDGIVDDLVFETELVKQIQIDIPYILQLIREYHGKNGEDKTIIVKIQKAVDSSPDLRDKKELIMQFIERMTPTPGQILDEQEDVEDEWYQYVREEKEKELNAIIKEENLKPEETRKFVQQAFADGYVTTTGVAITTVLPPMPVFGGKGNREEKKNAVLEKLKAFFNRYEGLLWGGRDEQVRAVKFYPNVTEDIYSSNAAEDES